MKSKLLSTPFLTLLVVAAFALLVHWCRNSTPTDSGQQAAFPMQITIREDGFSSTPSYPLPLHDWSVHFGSCGFGLIDCATEFRGDQPSQRVTLVRFGTWSAFCNFHAENFAFAVIAAALALIALAFFRHSRAPRSPKTRGA